MKMAAQSYCNHAGCSTLLCTQAPALLGCGYQECREDSAGGKKRQEEEENCPGGGQRDTGFDQEENFN